MNPFPFRNPNTDLTRIISEIVAPKGEKPAAKPDKYDTGYTPKTPRKPKADKWGGREPYVKNDRNPYVREAAEGDTHRITEPLNTESVIHENQHEEVIVSVRAFSDILKQAYDRGWKECGGAGKPQGGVRLRGSVQVPTGLAGLMQKAVSKLMGAITGGDDSTDLSMTRGTLSQHIKSAYKLGCAEGKKHSKGPSRGGRGNTDIEALLRSAEQAAGLRESHSRAQLEKMSTTQLRGLVKRYEALVLKGDRKASEELATVRGLLRSKGAGHALDEGRKGIGKTRYGAALKKLGDAAEAVKANPPKAPVNPFKKSVSEEMTPCEAAALKRLKSANTEDLKDKPGAAGERAHKRLHKTVAKLVGEEAVQEGVIGRAIERVRNKWGVGKSGRWETDSQRGEREDRDERIAAHEKGNAEYHERERKREQERTRERQRREAQSRIDRDERERNSDSSSKSDAGGKW